MVLLIQLNSLSQSYVLSLQLLHLVWVYFVEVIFQAFLDVVGT